MEYKFYIRKNLIDNSILSLEVNFNPNNYVLSCFFSILKIAKFPYYISKAIQAKGFGLESASIKFFHEMDWEDKVSLDIKDGDVNIYVYDGKSNEIVLNENLFIRILYDYSDKILKIYKGDNSLPENWFIEMEESLKQLKSKISSKGLELIQKSIFYNFSDGLKIFNNILSYSDWLSSTDFSIWSNSYVEVGDKKIYIIKENVKTLSTFSHFTKNELELLAEQYELEIKEENGIYYAYTPTHDSRQLEMSKNEELTVIYAIDGDRAPESIFIYGVFEHKD
jgi:hypothetical protein